MKQLKKGFTLIELLVVIAIIGILAAVVLVNVNSARQKAKAAAVTSALSQARTQMETNLDVNGQYLAWSDTAFANLRTSITNNTGSSSGSTLGNTYMVYATPTTTGAWGTIVAVCVDSTGTNKTYTSSPPTAVATTCP